MAEIVLAHTSQLDPAVLRAVRAMVERAFAGRFTEHDWDHALGGMHCIAWEDGEPVGHAAVVGRRLLHAGRALRTGYVEGVAVAPERQRGGHGDALMEAAEGVVTAAYEIGALSASEEGAPLYARRGWTLWDGPLAALTPAGTRPTPDEDGVYVLDPSGLLDPSGELTCDWRDGDVW